MDRGKIKIAIVANSLADGGAERTCALLSILLSRLNYQVHIVTVLGGVEYEYSGELLNLGLLKNIDDTILGRFKRLVAFKKYLNKNNFDWIIDHRTRKSSWSELIISKLIYNPKKVIYAVHSFKINQYFPSNGFIARRIYKDSPFLVTVSDEIKEEIQAKLSYKNVRRIYNPVDKRNLIDLSARENIAGRFILAYGRIDDDVKNFTLLIDSYSKSVLQQKNICLYIIGSGKDVDALKQKVNAMGLSENITFKAKMINPFPYVKAALFTVLTSRNEGFPGVITESLALGTPVISVDCQSGPRELIVNEKNGLLVENYNELALSKAMNRFVEDQVLYDICKNNSSASVEHLSLNTISREWQKILSLKDE